MKPQQLLEGINECIDKHHHREAGEWRYFPNENFHIDTSLANDSRFVQNFNKLIQDYFAGVYYQELLSKKKSNRKIYERNNTKKS